MTKQEIKFKEIKNRYIEAYKKANRKSIISLVYENGWCYLTTPTFGFCNKTKIRISQLEKMCKELELRNNKPTL